jgi:MFS family permease
MRLPGALERARSHAATFPRAYWILISGEAVQSLGVGLFLPYVTIYMVRTIGASHELTGLVLALWSLTALAGNPLGGVLTDRLGRRPVIIAGLAGAAVCSIGFGIASSVWIVAVLIVLWSLFESIFNPAAAAFVADVVGPERRVEAFGIWRLAGNGAIALGPPLGALVIWLSSIRVTFVLAGAPYLVYLAIAWRALPETRPSREHEEEPPRFRAALRDTVLLRLAVGAAIAAFVYAWYEDVVGLFLNEDRAVAVATWGLLFGINPILVVVLQLPIARWAARQSGRLVLAAGSLLQGLGLAVILPLEGIPVLVAAVFVFTVGEMLLTPVSSALASNLAPAHLRGSYQGVMNLAWAATGGPALVTGLWLVGHGHGELMLGLALPLGLLGSLAFLALPRRADDAARAAEPDTAPVAPLEGRA